MARRRKDQKERESAGMSAAPRASWRMRALATVLAVVLAWLVARRSKNNPQSRWVVAGYAPEYRLDHLEKHMSTVAAAVTDIIVFSAGVNAAGRISFDYVDQDRVRAFAAAARAHGVPRVLLCVGGAGRSAGFGRAARSEEGRERFAEEALALMQALDLDGVDLDWEAPATVQEEESYAKLIAACVTRFRERGRLVTFTIHYYQDFGAAAYAAADRVHFMTYDMNRRHSLFFDTKRATDLLLGRGMDKHKHKLVIGVPAYGRGIQDPALVQTYSEILAAHGAEAAADADETPDASLYYNGRLTVAEKTRWARAAGLGGVFMWELGQDHLDTPALSLLHVMAGAGR